MERKLFLDYPQVRATDRLRETKFYAWLSEQSSEDVDVFGSSLIEYLSRFQYKRRLHTLTNMQVKRHKYVHQQYWYDLWCFDAT